MRPLHLPPANFRSGAARALSCGGFILVFALFGSGCAASKKTAESPAGEGAEGAPEKSAKKKKKSGQGQGATDEATAPESPKAENNAAADDGALGSKSSDSEPKKPKKAPRPEMSKKAQGAFNAGKKAFSSGDLQAASAQYEAAIQADARAFEAHYALGVVNERLGRNSKALSSYKKAISIVPDHEEAIVAQGILMARQGKQDEAMSFLKKKSNEVGKSAPILAGMAEVSSLKGQSGEAQNLAQEALKVDPSYKPAMVTLARDHYRARRIDLALYALTGILDGYGEGNPPRDKGNAEAQMLRGLIYAERGLRGPAMEELEKAVKLRPDLVAAHLVLANFMMEAGNAKDARKHLETAIRYDNKNVAAHLQLGDAYRLLNRTEDAKREFEWVLVADPNQAAAHYNLGLLYLLGGKVKGMSESVTIDKALEHLEAYKARGVRGGPDDVDDLITRAKTKKALLNVKQQEGAGG